VKVIVMWRLECDYHPLIESLSARIKEVALFIARVIIWSTHARKSPSAGRLPYYFACWFACLSYLQILHNRIQRDINHLCLVIGGNNACRSYSTRSISASSKVLEVVFVAIQIILFLNTNSYAC